MKWARIEDLLPYMLYFSVGSLGFTLFATVWNIADSTDWFHNYMGKSFLFLAYWPSFLVRLDKPDTPLFFPLSILINAIGWGIAGFAIGWIVSVYRSRKKKRK
jgi:hypothetical protein